MKKFLSLLLTAAMLSLSSGCAVFRTEEESSSERSENSDNQISYTESSSSDNTSTPVTVGNLLENSFGKLWKNNKYYIDVKMTVEAYGNTTSNSSQAESSIYVYDYIIALDTQNAVAGLNMLKSDQTFNHCVIKNNMLYNIDDTTSSYTVSPYPDGEVYYAEQYTTDICLGLTNHLLLEDSGKTKYQNIDSDKQVDVEFEKYQITSSSEASGSLLGDASVIYYFKDGVPYAEVMKTSKGKTTFEFRTVSQNISTKDIFDIPENYSAVSEEPSAEVSSDPSDNSVVTQSFAR